MGWDKQKKTSISVKCQDYVVRSEKKSKRGQGGSGSVGSGWGLHTIKSEICKTNRERSAVAGSILLDFLAK